MRWGYDLDIQKIGKELLKKKNVVGYSGTFNKKMIDGKEVDVECITVYVDKKLPESEVKAKDMIPRHITNGTSCAVCTDVVEVGKHVAFPTVITERPVKAGASGMNYQGTACTLGAIAKSTKEGEDSFLLVVGNNHCIARENKANVGEDYLYPSPYDGGIIGHDTIAKTLRWVEIKFEDFACPFRNLGLKLYKGLKTLALSPRETPVNQVDIACAVIIIPHDEVSTEVYNIGKFTTKRRGVIGEMVHKCGRTTGYTNNGKLIDNNYFGQVQYSRGNVMFGPCALYSGAYFSQGGDSSSAILGQSDNSLQSFLFAGSDISTLGCHYDLVEQLLQVRILTEDEA